MCVCVCEFLVFSFSKKQNSFCTEKFRKKEEKFNSISEEEEEEENVKEIPCPGFCSSSDGAIKSASGTGSHLAAGGATMS